MGAAVANAGLAPLTFHDLRHTHVSWLIEQGWPEFKIVRRLGWGDGRMLYTVYGHLFPNHDDDLVALLDAPTENSAAYMLHASPR